MSAHDKNSRAQKRLRDKISWLVKVYFRNFKRMVEHILLPMQAPIEEQWLYVKRWEDHEDAQGNPRERELVEYRKLNVARMYTSLAADPVRNQALAELIAKASGRVLVFSGRTPQLDALYELVRVAGAKTCQRFYSVHKAEIHEETDCLFTTYQRQGFIDYEPGVVIYATPSRVKYRFPPHVKTIYPIDRHPLFERIAQVAEK